MGVMKILVVDDEYELAALLGIALRRLGHVPLLAINPEDALSLVTPDIEAVIMDIDMPVMSGVEMARILRAKRADLPIVFCTSSDPSDADCVEAASIGKVLPKVCSRDDAARVVDYLTGERVALDADAQTREKRYRARIGVRFDSAREFEREYTENLSKGGMFVRGADSLQPEQEVQVELELPGSGTVEVSARVAFVMDELRARRCGRQAGAGLMITEGPAGFQDALSGYLHCLERRRNFVVFAADDLCRSVLLEAGYCVLEAPPPNELVAAIARCEAPVVGVVVPRCDEPAYAREARAAGDPELVHGIDYVEELDESIAVFDQVL